MRDPAWTASIALLALGCRGPVGPATEPAANRPSGHDAPRASSRVADDAAEVPADPPSYVKGQTHVHSSGSYDAHTPPGEVFRFYAERGYDFVAISDHNRITDADAPEDMLAIRAVELTQNSGVCVPPAPGGYRCLFHSNVLFVDPARDRTDGGLIDLPFQEGRLAAYRKHVEFAERVGGLVVLNHPLFHFALDAKSIRQLARAGARHVEFFNASLDAQHPGGRQAAEVRAERLWDEVLSAGTLVYALATDDAHHFADAPERRASGKFAYAGDRAWIMVRAEKSADAIFAALTRGDFYCTSGVELRHTRLHGRSIEVAVDSESDRRHRIRFVGKGGAVLSDTTGSFARYEPSADEAYVRVVVEREDGARAWTQPLIWR